MTITVTYTNQSELCINLSGESIDINEVLKRGCLGRLSFTIAHEVVHHILNKICLVNYSLKDRYLPYFEKANNLNTET